MPDVQKAKPPATFSAGASSAIAVPINSARTGLVLVNLSANIISIGIGSPAVANSGISLPASAAWTMDMRTFSQQDIFVIAPAGASTLSIQEFE
jgi:hypothetical protein